MSCTPTKNLKHVSYLLNSPRLSCNGNTTPAEYSLYQALGSEGLGLGPGAGAGGR